MEQNYPPQGGKPIENISKNYNFVQVMGLIGVILLSVTGYSVM
jgi:hypothetical protein